MEKNIIDELVKTYVAPILREIIRDEISYLSPTKELPSDDDLLNARESAEFIGDALPTFYGRTSRGEISTYGSGKRIFCKRSELIAWKEKQRTKSKDLLEEEVDDFLAKKGSKRD